MFTYKNEGEGIAKYENPEFNLVRVLPDSFRAPSSSVIYKDKLLIQIFGERFIAIVIQSKQISDAYRHYFNFLWDIGKPLK